MAACSAGPGVGLQWPSLRVPGRAEIRLASKARLKSSCSRAAGATLAEVRAGDLLALRVGPEPLYLEVLRAAGDGGGATAQFKGQLLQVTAAPGADGGSDALQLAPQGGWPPADGAVLSRFGMLSAVLPALHAHAAGEAPARVPAGAWGVVESLAGLQARVAADPSPWCDGLEPSAPPPTPLDSALLAAGELAALLAGRRGVVLLQLFNGWDPSKGQPAYAPYALTLLERALTTPGVAAAASVAPGGSGLTAVVHADQEPFASYAAHLASFGCQANIVAGSPYYQLLIGRLLGYREDRVVAYVEAAGGGAPLPHELRAQVTGDIAALSSAAPKLPWAPRGQAAAAAAPAAGAAPGAAPASAQTVRKGGAKKAGGGGGFGAKARR